jgi:hypothetical protein
MAASRCSDGASLRPRSAARRAGAPTRTIISAMRSTFAHAASGHAQHKKTLHSVAASSSALMSAPLAPLPSSASAIRAASSRSAPSLGSPAPPQPRATTSASTAARRTSVPATPPPGAATIPRSNGSAAAQAARRAPSWPVHSARTARASASATRCSPRTTCGAHAAISAGSATQHRAAGDEGVACTHVGAPLRERLGGWLSARLRIASAAKTHSIPPTPPVRKVARRSAAPPLISSSARAQRDTPSRLQVLRRRRV